MKSFLKKHAIIRDDQRGCLLQMSRSYLNMFQVKFEIVIMPEEGNRRKTVSRDVDTNSVFYSLPTKLIKTCRLI